MDALRNPELERAISIAWYAREPWLAYARWLHERGDPWGARIQLGVDRHYARDPAELDQLDWYADQLDREHRAYFLGPLADPPAGLRVELRWTYGLVEALRITGPSEPATRAWLSAVLDHPAARLLRRVEVLLDAEESGRAI